MKHIEAIFILAVAASFTNLLFTDKLKFYIYPGHTWLVIAAIILLFFTGLELIRKPTHSHFKLIQGVILLPIIIAFFWQPKVLSVDAALDRGAIYELSSGKQQTNFNINPENRTLIDWVRLFSANPEPSKYIGQKVKVEGFILPDQNLPSGQFLLSKFILSCCTADARPIGVPAFFIDNSITLSQGTWIEASGEIVESNTANIRRAVIQINSFKKIPEPKNPYEYQ